MVHSEPENLTKTRPKKLVKSINQFHNFFWPNSIFCSFKNGQKSIVALGKSLKRFQVFFGLNFLNFLTLCGYFLGMATSVIRSLFHQWWVAKQEMRFILSSMFKWWCQIQQFFCMTSDWVSTNFNYCCHIVIQVNFKYLHCTHSVLKSATKCKKKIVKSLFTKKNLQKRCNLTRQRTVCLTG